MCHVCKTTLANRVLPFEKEREKIAKNEKLSPEQKEKKVNELLDALELKLYCCRTELLTYIDKVSEHTVS